MPYCSSDKYNKNQLNMATMSYQILNENTDFLLINTKLLLFLNCTKLLKKLLFKVLIP